MPIPIESLNFIEPLINSFKVMNEEYSNLFDEGLKDYLKDQTEKHYHTYNFLHRYEKVEFYKVYYPAKATYNELHYDFKNVRNVLEEHPYITFVGTAGSGKSTLLKYLFLESIKSKFRIPIFLELRKLNSKKTGIVEYISDQIGKLAIKPGKRTLERALKHGSFIFLLDGFDEIYSSNKQDILNGLEEFIDQFPNNNYVITTRPGSGVERFPRFCDFHIDNLSSEEVKEFIGLVVFEKERKDRILNMLKESSGSNYQNFLSNPLLLSMFILTFEHYPEIPKKKVSFYRNVFDTLYSKHDGVTKNSFPREKLTGLQRDDFESILNTFSYLTLIEGEFSFTNHSLAARLKVSSRKLDISIENLIHDLETSISIITLDGIEYKFPHRSLQEYFAANFILSLPENKKELAFKRINISLSSHLFDSGSHFWDLCQELDNISYIKFCMIPVLREFIGQLDLSSNRSTLLSFFKLYEPSISSFYTELDNELVIARYINMYGQFMAYNGVYQASLIYDFFRQNKVTQEIEEGLMQFLTNETDMDFDFIESNEEVIDLFLKSGIVATIKECIKVIKEKLKECETIIESEADDLETLLDF